MKRNNKRSFTLIEVMACTAILVGALVSLMSLYVYCFELQETSINMPNALFQIRAKLEEIRSSSFSTIVANYNQKTYSLNVLNGKMYVEASYVNGTGNNLIDIRIIAGWVQKGGRIIGEGRLDTSGNFVFYDLNSNGKYESPLELLTSIANRQ